MRARRHRSPLFINTTATAEIIDNCEVNDSRSDKIFSRLNNCRRSVPITRRGFPVVRRHREEGRRRTITTLAAERAIRKLGECCKNRRILFMVYCFLENNAIMAISARHKLLQRRRNWSSYRCKNRNTINWLDNLYTIIIAAPARTSRSFTYHMMTKQFSSGCLPKIA
jgi:uncharacterized DUF497 family protein